jgi:predicted TIM-barrel fold metal-dependent hydrolase
MMRDARRAVSTVAANLAALHVTPTSIAEKRRDPRPPRPGYGGLSGMNHPIIDSDAHYNELAPVFREQFLEIVGDLAGADLRRELAAAPDLRRYLVERTTPMGQAFGSQRWATSSADERRDRGMPVPGWAPPHANPLDKATSLSPQLRYERMDEIGIDFSVLYPGIGLFFPHIEPDELRQVACRAYNIINAETYAPYRDRMTPAAVIPMSTPAEAVAELEHAVTARGYKVAMFGHIARPVPSVHRERPDLFQTTFRLDAFGIDSDYDYDPFWRRCAELRVPLAAHTPAYGTGFRRSPTNYMNNQTGNFAEAGDLLCRSLFLGGVTRRFPTLRFQFLECGVGWACVLYAELVHRWEKRNIATLREHVEAAKAMEAEFVRLMHEHGDPRMQEHLLGVPDGLAQQGVDAGFDDFAAGDIRSVDDIYELFVPRFFFGCEADDPITPWAFNTAANPLGASLRATLGSDMGHWDVPDMRGIVPEARELVERGLIDEDDFRRFTFEYPCDLFAGVNPEFFAGTRVEPFVLTATA